MSGQWQQYPPTQGGYQQQGGYPPNGYAPEAGYPPQGGYGHAYYQQPQPGSYPHPHQAGYPQHQGFPQPPHSGYPQQPQPTGYPPQQNGYPQAPQNAMYHQAAYQQPHDGGHSQPQPSAYPPQGAYYQQPGSYPHQQGAYPPQGGQFGGQPMPPYGQYPPQPQTSQPYPHPSYQAPQHPPTPSYQSPQQYPPTQQGPSPPAGKACFNCGAPDHWAQECPEPRRQFQYGQNVQASRQPRRLRPPYKPPIITKYPVPPHVANAQPTPPYSAPPAWGQQPQAYSTPSTTLPSPAQSWPETSPHQPDGARYPQVPTPDSQGHQLEQRRPPGLSHEVLTPPYGTEQTNESRVAVSEHNEKALAPVPMSRNQSKASVSTNQSVSMASDSEDEDDEEYLRLDIPDLPNLNCYGGAKAPQLVADPLPALSETDDVGKLGHPENGKIRSKYHDAASVDLLEANVRHLIEFEGLEDDPMFRTLVEDQPKYERVRERTPLKTPPRDGTPRHRRPSRRSASPARNEPSWERRPRSRQEATPTYHRESPFEDGPRSLRGGTPVNNREYQTDKQSNGFDPFDPASGNLDDLIRKHYPDATRKRGQTEASPPPPPPPPPPEPYYSNDYPNGSGRRRRGYSAHGAESANIWGGDGHESSPTEHGPRKRKHDNEDTRREGQRQRDTTTKRRTAPKIADVYSRRW